MKNLSTESLIMQNKPPNFNEMKKTIKHDVYYLLLKLENIINHFLERKHCGTRVYEKKYLLQKVYAIDKMTKNKSSKFVHKN